MNIKFTFENIDEKTIKTFDSNESLFIEHKEFSLNYNKMRFCNRRYYYNDDNEDIDLDYFNKLVMEEFKNYISKYFPKYFSIFINSIVQDNKNDYAYLNFGISDDGYVTAIPIMKDNKHKIKEIISEQLVDIIKNRHIIEYNGNEEELSNLLKDLIIQICPIKKENNSAPNNNPIQLVINQVKKEIEEYDKQFEEYLEKYIVYKKEFEIWDNLMCKYGGKMNEMLKDDNMRGEFVDFVLKEYQENYQTTIDDNNRIYSVGDYNILIEFPIEEQNNAIMKINDIFMNFVDYDLALKKFRDVTRNELLNFRPEKPKFFTTDPRYHSLSRITPLLDILQKYDDIEFIVIRFKIPLHKRLTIAYKNDKYYHIKSRSIITINGKTEPISNDVEID